MKKKSYDKTPFDRFRIPPKQNIIFTPFIWLASFLITKSHHLKVHRHNMKGLKPPFLVLGTHHSFMDFFVTPVALFPHRANYVSELEGFENFGEWLYRQAGCLGTRKFVNDLALVRNIKKVMDRNGILVLYPEARYANVGTSSPLPQSVSKLAKMLKVPIVTINMKGNYLNSPIWNLKAHKGVKLEADLTQLFTAEQVQSLPASEIQTKIEEALKYDEYAWQYEKKIEIHTPWRAEGLEMALYQCPCCTTEFKMKSCGAKLFCESCGASWEMSLLGRMEYLKQNNVQEKKDANFSHIPDWYEWQRAQVQTEIDEGRYVLDTPVTVDELPNAVNFIPHGAGRLVHNLEGFELHFNKDEEPAHLHFASSSLFSIHTEYEYRGKGQCMTLSTVDNTYFIFPESIEVNVTKIQYATEYFYRLSKQEKQKNNKS